SPENARGRTGAVACPSDTHAAAHEIHLDFLEPEGLRDETPPPREHVADTLGALACFLELQAVGGVRGNGVVDAGLRALRTHLHLLPVQTATLRFEVEGRLQEQRAP